MAPQEVLCHRTLVETVIPFVPELVDIDPRRTLSHQLDVGLETNIAESISCIRSAE